MPTDLGTTSPVPFTLGEATSFGGLSLVALFASAPPGLHFIGLDEAMVGGLAISEVDEAGMVSGLSVSNLLDLDVLLFEGEELVGAKQNRILDRTILVAAISKTQVPVSCVERGRWSYRSRQFAAAPRAPYPELRRMKREGGGQAQVWSEISEKAGRLDARSDTDAAEQMYVSRGASLDEYLASLPPSEGQCGSVACIGGRVVLKTAPTTGIASTYGMNSRKRCTCQPGRRSCRSAARIVEPASRNGTTSSSTALCPSAERKSESCGTKL
jgi:hypothetical protein